MAPTDCNPYAAPTSEGQRNVSMSRGRYAARSFIAYLLAAASAFTAALTGWLWFLGGIDLGRYGIVFLGSLVLGAALLVIAARHYSVGSRRTAIVLGILVLLIIASAILLALYDAGVITLS